MSTRVVKLKARYPKLTLMLVQAKARPSDETGCLMLNHLANRAKTCGNRAVLVAMRILSFARVKPKVSEKTNDAPVGNTLVLLLFLLNFQSANACTTCSSVTNVPLLNIEAAYSSALFLQREGSTRRAGPNFFERVLFARSLQSGDARFTILGQHE